MEERGRAGVSHSFSLLLQNPKQPACLWTHLLLPLRLEEAVCRCTVSPTGSADLPGSRRVQGVGSDFEGIHYVITHASTPAFGRLINLFLWWEVSRASAESQLVKPLFYLLPLLSCDHLLNSDGFIYILFSTYKKKRITQANDSIWTLRVNSNCMCVQEEKSIKVLLYAPLCNSVQMKSNQTAASTIHLNLRFKYRFGRDTITEWLELLLHSKKDLGSSPGQTKSLSLCPMVQKHM